MTPTRLSKIARLPANVREELNHRLHDGELSRTILPWVNSLPKTRKIMAELFNGKPITHQNLSEWRRAGYQDWLFHQQRIDWFHRLTEEEGDIQKHDKCNDTFEAMSNYFLFELGQGVRALQTMKDPFERMERMQHLSREFARLQNAFNWSRRVQLEWDKANHRFDKPSGTGVPPVSPHPHRQDARATNQPDTETKASGASPSARTVLASRALVETNAGEVIEIVAKSEPTPKRQGADALQDAPRTPETQEQRASVSDCGSPLPLSDVNSQTLPNFQPLPPLAPTTPTPKPYLQTPSPPMRGRRFVCIEG